MDSCGTNEHKILGVKKEKNFKNIFKTSRFLALSQVKTLKSLTMERLALDLDVKVSPLAQSIPNRAQMSPA